MREIFYIFLIICFIITIFSCGKTTEENVNDTVSKTNENIEGILEDNNDTIATDTSSDNPSIKFFKKIIPGDGDGNTVNYCYLGADIKQTDDIDKMFEPILTMTDAIITPVMPMTLD